MHAVEPFDPLIEPDEPILIRIIVCEDTVVDEVRCGDEAIVARHECVIKVASIDGPSYPIGINCPLGPCETSKLVPQGLNLLCFHLGFGYEASLECWID